jgi:two-component system, OmpR family, response regulator QseB
MRILLVEDDELLGDGLQAGLIQRSYTVDWVKDGLAAEQALEYDDFDVIVLDLGLPKRSGLSVLETIRKKGKKTPVLILTARESVDDKILGLDTGADDYMVKPCDLDELAARIRALHRRKTGSAAPVVEHRGLTLDPSSHSITFENEVLNLARREYALLEKLLENVGKIVSRDQLQQTLYGWTEIDSNTLEVHIHNIRKKLPKNFIRTIRGVGYMIEKNAVESGSTESQSTSDLED